MATFLFDKIIFGPVHSRRLGVSLGINLLPDNKKFCNYNCVYCECGWSEPSTRPILPSSGDVIKRLEEYLRTVNAVNKKPDVITFAGNGEPTLHPEFSEIINQTIILRDKYFPEIKIAVLTNATTLENANVVNALNSIEMPILKIDTLVQEDYERINCPNRKIDIDKLVDQISSKIIRPIVQTMFFKVDFPDALFDNTTEVSVNKWLMSIKKINPEMVMIYSVSRDTPMQGIIRIGIDELNKIGELVNKLGIKTLITP